MSKTGSGIWIIPGMIGFTTMTRGRTQHCVSGRPFEERDQWQVWPDMLYKRKDTGEIVAIRDQRPGMMWDVWWMTGGV